MIPTHELEMRDMLIREYYYSSKWFIFRFGKYQKKQNGKWYRFIEIEF